LRLLASQLGIDASVVFTGNVSRAELIRLLHSAEVFCHPAIWESFFPAAPLEAMACGLPALVSSVGALPELVGTFAGLVHAAGDDEQLALNLLDVLTNEPLRRALGSAARTRIEEQFTWQGMCDAYFELYRHLAAEHH
jgi:glycosyltransferase involved in cell wall biosynthesis